eukprot:tig00001604_g9407.t1
MSRLSRRRAASPVHRASPDSAPAAAGRLTPSGQWWVQLRSCPSSRHAGAWSSNPADDALSVAEQKRWPRSSTSTSAPIVPDDSATTEPISALFFRVLLLPFPFSWPAHHLSLSQLPQSAPAHSSANSQLPDPVAESITNAMIVDGARTPNYRVGDHYRTQLLAQAMESAAPVLPPGVATISFIDYAKSARAYDAVALLKPPTIASLEYVSFVNSPSPADTVSTRLAVQKLLEGIHDPLELPIPGLRTRAMPDSARCPPRYLATMTSSLRPAAG